MPNNNPQIIGAPVSKYLGIWAVDEIYEGSTGIQGDWATIGRHMALYQREDGVVLGFCEDGFCLETYEPFWFKYCEQSKCLTGVGRDGIVKITVGFSDPAFKKISFNFSHVNGDSHAQGGGWGGIDPGGG